MRTITLRFTAWRRGTRRRRRDAPSRMSTRRRSPARQRSPTFIVMVADRDTLTQNGVDFTDIRITALGPDGQSKNMPLRAQIYRRWRARRTSARSARRRRSRRRRFAITAPPASALAAGQVAQTVTLVVTPANAGDFRGEIPRQIDIRLLPQGIILPTNPNLVAAFTFTPAAPQVIERHVRRSRPPRIMAARVRQRTAPTRGTSATARPDRASP